LTTADQRSPAISVIIAAHNSQEVLGECLAALRSVQPTVREIIVVDDGSTDRTAEIANHHGATVIALASTHFANYCRNLGAERATGDILLFVDSDVVVQPDTVEKILDAFESENTDAVIGLYSSKHRHENIASQYKNLWIRYSYLKSLRTIDWIFGAVAAVRTEAFRKASGFDRTLFMNKGGDLELGKRMANSRPAIVLNPAVQVEHLKRHTLTSLLRNDYERSQGFVQLAAKLGQLARSLRKGFVNIYPGFAYSSILAWAFVASLLIGFWVIQFRWLAVLCASAYLSLNLGFLIYYARHRRLQEIPAVLGIMFLDHLVCALGSLRGVVRWLRSR